MIFLSIYESQKKKKRTCLIAYPLRGETNLEGLKNAFCLFHKSVIVNLKNIFLKFQSKIPHSVRLHFSHFPFSKL